MLIGSISIQVTKLIVPLLPISVDRPGDYQQVNHQKQLPWQCSRQLAKSTQFVGVFIQMHNIQQVDTKSLSSTWKFGKAVAAIMPR